MGKSTGRCPKKPKDIESHKNKYLGVSERENYVKMAEYVKENPFTGSQSFKISYNEIIKVEDITRQQYNQMETWYNLSLNLAENNPKGKHLDNIL